jgi:integrase
VGRALAHGAASLHILQQWQRVYSLGREKKIRTTTEITFTEATDLYLTHLRDEKGLRPASVTSAHFYLRAMFDPVREEQLCTLTAKRAEQLYSELKVRPLHGAAKKGATPSAAYQRGALGGAKTFAAWCVGKGWLPSNPFASVKPTGRVNRGKPQLRIDEARAWLTRALELAPTEPGAVAAAMSLLCAMRVGEIVGLSVRDLDDGGRQLWIADAKTAAGRRTLIVPDVLRPFLLALAEGRPGEASLFSGRKGDWVRSWVQKIARQVGVPEVCAHSMRGLHSTLAIEAGATSQVVAASLGHTSPTMTREHYIAPGTVEQAEQRAVLRLVAGGKG